MEIKAYVLIKVVPGRADGILSVLQNFEEVGVERANITTGVYNIIALVKGEDLTRLGEFIVNEIHDIKGVSSTITCIIVA